MFYFKFKFMNKKFLTVAVFATMCLFATTSCSNDDDIINGGNGIENVEGITAGEITLALNGGGEGMNTRGIGRPVNSSAAANNVDEVQLKLFKKTGSEKSYTYTEVKDGISFVDGDTKMPDGKIKWTNGTPTEGTPGYEDEGRDTKKTIKLNNLDSETTYKLVAYGYKKGFEPYSTSATWDQAKAWYTSAAVTNSADEVQELFGGYVEFSTDENSKITDLNVTVTLKRQVAGLLGYFKNIPIKKLNNKGEECTVTGIEVRANATTTKLVFPVDNENNTNRLNGSGQTEQSTVLLKYDLSKYSAQVTSAEIGDVYQIPAQTGKVVTVENSLLAGRFVIPYESHVATNTLTVALTSEKGDVRTWKIKINKENNTAFSGEDAYNYDILRNSFYSIGKKLKSDVAPVDPQPDPDEPVDLSQDNDIILIVNDAWDIVYDMGLGD